MKTITFHCETITPMFLAGADGQTPELRPPSIKGAMRFWWRALHGHLSLTDLKKKEVEIFGGSYKDEKGNEVSRKSQIFIDVSPTSLSFSRNKLNGKKFKVKGHELDILDYLAYGTNSYKKNLKLITFDRDYIKANQKFEIQISYKNSVHFTNDILKPIVLMYRIGGIGSKSRNGFGKFNIIECKNELGEDIALPHISEVLNSDKHPKEFSVLSNEIEAFQLIQIRSNFIDTLSDLGLIYKSIRTNQNFEQKHHYEKRSYIASPLQVKDINHGLLESRHSKSYFLTLSKSNNRYKGYIYFIPLKFLSGFDDLSDNEYDKLMNQDHNDFDKEEQFYTDKYQAIHDEFNELLCNNPKLKTL